MEAWVLTEFEAPLQKVQRPLPKPKGTEVLIEVTHCGVCHSDIHVWEGYYDMGGGKRFEISQRGVKLPLALGHEILGTVAGIGPDAEGVKLGDRRTVFPWVGCDHCRRCDDGEDNMCLQQRSLGVFQDGGFASHVLVPHPRYLVDFGSLDPAVACTFGCSGITTLNAVRKVLPSSPDEPLVLIGAGGLGLAAISMAHALGHRAIISVDINAEKREAALKSGATAVVDGAVDDPAKAVMSAAGGPVLAVADFVNGSKTAELCFNILGRGGKMVQIGIMGGEFKVSLVTLLFKAATIMSSLTGNPANLREVVSLAKEGKLAPIPVTTIPWDEADSAIRRLREGKVTGRLVLTRS